MSSIVEGGNQMTLEQKLSLHKSLAKFHNNVPTIVKDKKAYNYRYASLPNVLRTIRPVLSECNLDLRHYTTILEDGTHCVCSELFDLESGATVSVSLPIIRPTDSHMTSKDCQAIGSSVTYMMRYTIAILLTLEVDEDDDGEAASKRHQDWPHKCAAANAHQQKQIQGYDKKSITDEQFSSAIEKLATDKRDEVIKYISEKVALTNVQRSIFNGAVNGIKSNLVGESDGQDS